MPARKQQQDTAKTPAGVGDGSWRRRQGQLYKILLALDIRRAVRSAPVKSNSIRTRPNGTVVPFVLHAFGAEP